MKLTGVMQIQKKSGKVFTYYRRRGMPLVRLPDLPHDDPEFLKAYAEAREASPKRRQSASGTIDALVTACTASEAYMGLSGGYRGIMRRHFDSIRSEYGALQYVGMRDRHISADVRSARDPSARLKAWRFLCAFAVSNRLLHSDPSNGITVKAKKTEGHPPWTQEEVAAFRTHWAIDTAPRRAFELLYWTGARISDAVKIGPGMVDRDGVLSYEQTKTKQTAFCPWHCDLPEYAQGMEVDRDTMLDAIGYGRGHMTFLATAQGRTRSSKALGGMIRKAARAAGIQKSAHGLRKSRAVLLAEAGATPHKIGAWTGHYSLQEVTHYTKKVDRKRAVMGTEQKQNVQTPAIQIANPNGSN